MSKIRFVSLLKYTLSLFLCHSALPAQSYDWQGSIVESSQKNPELNAARASLRSSLEQVHANFSGYFPQVSASLGVNHGTSTPVAGSLLNFSSTQASTSYTASLSASEQLFSGFQTMATVQQSEANAKVAEAALQTTRAKVSYDLRSAFVGLIYAQNYIKLSHDILKRREDNLRNVELQFENGKENKGSLLLSKAYLKQAQYEQLLARDTLELAQKQLAHVLGHEDTEEIHITGDIPQNEAPKNVDLTQIGMQSADHLQALSQKEASLAAVKIARSPLLPTLSLTASTAESAHSFFPNDKNTWALGLNLTYLFNSGGKDYFATQAASETFVAASLNQASVDSGLYSKLKIALNNFTEAVAKLEVDRSFLDATEVREKIARSKYNNGLLSFEEWDIIENDFINRQKTALLSERDRVLAEGAWEQAQGKGVIP